MPLTVPKIIGVMDPNGYSFRVAFEQLIAFLEPRIKIGHTTFEVKTRRIISRPYNVLGAQTSCAAVINRGLHWNPHHNYFFQMVTHQTYLLNDMLSFTSIKKNPSYGQMYELGLRIPKTWALPPRDYSSILKEANVDPDLIFPEHEAFDLVEIGEKVGYPAFLKPQDGGGWEGVVKVNDAEELQAAYDRSGERPMNLQEAIDYREFVRTVGVGPQMFPMHYNAAAKYSHDRYLRSATMAVEMNFLSAAEYKEACQITKLINAFYNWDHNSCETLIGLDGVMYPIDFANAYPDSSLISLHFYFPDLVKAMARWLIFCAVTGRKKPLNFTYQWEAFHDVRERAEREGWDYGRRLDAYEEIADRHFDTAHFHDFCAVHLPDFDERAYEFFASDAFDEILVNQVRRYFKIPHEVPGKVMHYRGIHHFWLKCERDRLASA